MDNRFENRSIMKIINDDKIVTFFKFIWYFCMVHVTYNMTVKQQKSTYFIGGIL